MPRPALFFIAIVALGVAVTTGCGYTREGRGANLDTGIRSVAIPVFRNDTFEAGLETIVTDALRREFLLHNFVKIAPAEKADAIAVGVIRKFNTKPISFSETDFATEYRASIRMSLKIVAPDGHVLWADERIAEVAEYPANEDVFASEANKRAAIRSIAEKIARDTHARIFDGFPAL
ncbi:MAG: hypothetical protein H6684_06940 [Deltaproteobacteria bacterium]|nr:hypothetical protein [Deltaproteobacteria bacterium]MCB9479521.1 hypothetical protein [Deltaproteobacteria bacterium]MCB9488449.1 hypothetical protein [Deltaproteobacteria bacterium]